MTITKQHFTLILLGTSMLLVKPAMAWSPLKRRAATPTNFDAVPTHSPMTVSSSIDSSRLYFRNGQEIDSENLLSSLLIFPDESTSSTHLPTPPPTTTVTLSVTETNKVEPRFMDLPRHSPPEAVIRWQKLLLDVEMIIGRLSMVAALVLLANEVITGSSLSEQMTRLFG